MIGKALDKCGHNYELNATSWEVGSLIHARMPENYC
jgi:hypothetical protein